MLFKKLLHSAWMLRACKSKMFCTSIRPTLSIECLKSRSVLKVTGDEVTAFMQGIVTNDMRHLEEGACSMYTMFLNTKGRVIYDAIIYSTPDKFSFLVECDSAALQPLLKHLVMFRVRRKIAIDSLADDMSVWAIFDPNADDSNQSPDAVNNSQNIIDLVTSFGNKHKVTVCRDPRLAALGVRIIAPKTKDVIKLAEEIGATPSDGKLSSYKTIRYKLGVGEGVDDLPPGKCFPLEANCDYLHGVSFHKGCYIGQELTARTHHTGVVRKRLMPIEFNAKPSGFVPDAPIHHGSGCSNALGKLRGANNNVGLALLRVTEALDAQTLRVLDVTAQTVRPKWWPQEAPKDRVMGKDQS